MANTPNWKPWQTSPFLIGALLAILVAIVGVLEFLAQQSIPSVSTSGLREVWLDWYTARVRSARSIRNRDFTFAHNSTNCLQGFMNLEDVNNGTYFAWVYLPSLLAILLGIAWGVVDTEVKRVEPYYQMSRPEGAKAENSIFAEYISLPSFLSPFQAIRWKQWVVLLSAVSYVVISVVTPVLQSQLFQIQVQVLTVGYFDDGEYNYFSSQSDTDWDYYIEEFANHKLYGRCWVVGDDWEGGTTYIGEIFDGNAYDGESQFDDGALRAVVYLNPAMARAQEAVLLLVVVLGAGLIWKSTLRKSGMTTSYASLATLVGIAHVYPDFLQHLSGIMDLDVGRSRTWSQFLSKQIVHLGTRPACLPEKPPVVDVHECLDDHEYSQMLRREAEEQTGIEMEELGGPPTQDSSQGHDSLGPYGLYFEPFHTETPPLPPTKLIRPFQYFHRVRWAMLLTAIGLFFCFIMSLVSGGTSAKVYAPDASFTQSSKSQSLSIVVLVVTAIVKSIWKMVEANVMEMAVFRFRYPSCPEGRLQAYPLFAREYNRLPPIWITIAAFRDKQIMLGLVTFASLCLEIAFLLLAIVTSMNTGQGFSATTAPRVGWAAAAFIGFVGFFAFYARWRLALGYPNLLCKQGSIASLLGEVALSEQLLNDLHKPGKMRLEKHRAEYLKNLQIPYCLGRVAAPNLTNGATYMLERKEVCLPDVRPTPPGFQNFTTN